MSNQVIGIVLLVGGLALLGGGYMKSQSVSRSLRSFLGFTFSKETMWFILGGIAAFLAGLFVLMGR